MINKEVKGMLARCLATENLVVEHRNVMTAMFDVDKRVLTLPNWQKASNTVYDLLVAHEVGHALYTDNVDWRVEYPDVPKDFVNVVEDARIERMMKKKYPGLSRTFYNGYQELNGDDFFSVKNERFKKMSLIDRINLYFKIGAFHQIPFNDTENEFLTCISIAETFDDVLKISQSIYDYVKTKGEEDKMNFPQMGDHSSPMSSSSGDEGNQEGEEVEENNTGEEQDSEESGESGDSEEDCEGEDIDNDADSSNGGMQPEDKEINEMESKTSSSFEEKSKELNNRTDDSVSYVELPEFDLSKTIIPNNHIHKLNEVFYSEDYYQEYVNGSNQNYIEFKKKSEREVSYLVKEFECKKSADQYARASTARTGVLDTTKLHTYKYNEDLFRKVSIIPDGKNHGLIFILDWSGSMCDYLLDTYKQLCCLIWFCRKVSIPFEVYSFTNDPNAYIEYDPNHGPTYEPKNGFIVPEKSFRLMNIFTSKVNNRELENQMKTMWRICDAFQSRYGYVPNHMALSGTPLGETMIALNQVIPNFVSQYKVQKTNVVFLTDGEGYTNPSGISRKNYNGEEYIGVNYSWQTVIRNRKNGRMYPAYTDRNFPAYSKILMSYLKDSFTNVNFINFRIANAKELRNCWHNFSDKTDYEKVRDSFRKNKFVSFQKSGFDKFFVLSSNNMNDDSEFEVAEDATKSQIKTAFVKSLSKKKTNKKVLSEFISMVC